jgi:uncharacterized membrane protein
MQSPARLFGHAIHPVLIVFPLGLLSTAVVFDVVHFATDRTSFAIAAGYMIAAGVLGGLVAAIFGLVDYLAIPSGTRAKRVAQVHGLGNVLVVLLFAVSWLLRYTADTWNTTAAEFVLALVGLVVAGVTGWLGGELVQRLGVGVDDGANLDAPSSLSRASVRNAPR